MNKTTKCRTPQEVNTLLNVSRNSIIENWKTVCPNKTKRKGYSKRGNEKLEEKYLLLPPDKK